MYKSSRKLRYNNISYNNDVISYNNNYITAYWGSWYSQISLFRHFQAYSGICSHVHLEHKTSSRVCETCKMMYYISSIFSFLSLNRFFNFQGYLGIFRDIDAYSATHTGTQLGGEGRPPLSYLNMENKFSDFGKKGPTDYVHIWVKFSIQNVVLRIPWRKNSKMFSCGPLFLVFSLKCLSKCPSSTQPCFPMSFSKLLHLKCLTVFSKCLSQ